ncbi:MAG: DUF433 domain-containing protein [Chloroflexi bacterium]|nr:DUF433 domain-containing protein [Chloroflexota bacterium]
MTRNLNLQSIPLPLFRDNNGVVKIVGTRVTLDTLIGAFLRGATAEEIAGQYPTLDLSDIYLTISFYLQNKAEVETYLEQRTNYRQAVKKENQKRFSSNGLREKLLARKTR